MTDVPVSREVMAEHIRRCGCCHCTALRALAHVTRHGSTEECRQMLAMVIGAAAMLAQRIEEGDKTSG